MRKTYNTLLIALVKSFFRWLVIDSRIGLERFNTVENFLAAVDVADNSARDFFRLKLNTLLDRYTLAEPEAAWESISSLHLLVYERDIPIARKETIPLREYVSSSRNDMMQVRRIFYFVLKNSFLTWTASTINRLK